MAIPLLLVGLIQAGVGATIRARTDPQVAALKAQYQAAPATFKTQELARMKAVSSSFIVYKSIEALYQFAFNRLDMMSIHGLRGVVDEESDRGRQANRCAVGGSA